MEREKKFWSRGSQSLVGIVVLIILVVALVSTSFSLIVTYRKFSSLSDDSYKERATYIANTAAALIDGDTIRDYAFTREIDEEYEEIYRQLDTIRVQNDVQYLYVQAVDGDEAISIIDTDPEQPMAFRERAPLSVTLDEEQMQEGIPAFLDKSEYTGNQWVVSVFCPIKDSAGETQAFVGVDILVNDIKEARFEFLRQTVSILVMICLALIFFFIYLSDRVIVKPIQRLSKAAQNFVNTDKGDLTTLDTARESKAYAREIRDLQSSIIHMELDIRDYIRHLTTITAEKERIGAELNVATQIQASMLPSIFPAFPNRTDVDLYASMTPAKEVGGDFYDFFLIDKEHVGLVMADVSGKGVPAALFMMISKTLIKNQSQNSLSPAEILYSVNNQLCENNEADMFVTAWLGIIDLSTGLMTAANAGHEYPAIRRKDGSFELLRDRHGLALACMENVRYREYTISFNTGDMIFVYTDGVAEATNAQDELFGTDRMLEALNRAEPDPKLLLKEVRKSIDDFVQEAPQFDDITMLCFVYKGKNV